MAGWTTPVDQSTGHVVTATDWNATGQDDLTFLAGGAGAQVATTETTTTTASYGDLTTVGPAVTVTTGTHAIVMISFQGSNNTGSDGCLMSFAISGATTLAAADNNSACVISTSTNSGSTIITLSGLTAGSNTFTAKYKALTGGTASFMRRNITVIPLP